MKLSDRTLSSLKGTPAGETIQAHAEVNGVPVPDDVHLKGLKRPWVVRTEREPTVEERLAALEQRLAAIEARGQ
jgi:hypothetical protein